jgi:hypothetical protein
MINLGFDTYYLKYCGAKFNPNDVQLVVARYNEDVRWVHAYNDIAVVYNKGIHHRILDTLNTVIKIDNVGRESDTYLHHIITNYNKLAKRIIFSQGDPFAHNETLLFAIDNCEKLKDVMPRGLQYIAEKNIPPRDILEKIKETTEYGLEYSVLTIDADGFYTDDNYFIDEGVSRFVKEYRDFYKPDATLPIMHSMLNRSNFPYYYTDKFRFTYAGLFSVTNRVIRQHRLQIYKNLKNELVSQDSQGGVNGYLMERLWLHIFKYV